LGLGGILPRSGALFLAARVVVLAVAMVFVIAMATAAAVALRLTKEQLRRKTERFKLSSAQKSRGLEILMK
jgi:cbb3-type cytochrome oxidase cytochrome c subunit